MIILILIFCIAVFIFFNKHEARNDKRLENKAKELSITVDEVRLKENRVFLKRLLIGVALFFLILFSWAFTTDY